AWVSPLSPTFSSALATALPADFWWGSARSTSRCSSQGLGRTSRQTYFRRLVRATLRSSSRRWAATFCRSSFGTWEALGRPASTTSWA
ncbi:unnamed protein product, partial [Symbiodinium sp. KB8]